MKLLQTYVDDLINRALAEDINYIDMTTDMLIDENDISGAYFVAKAEGVLSGIDIAARVFYLLDDTVTFDTEIHDGERVKKGDIIARVKGHTAAMLKAERTSLNILQHMSGIATYTNKCVKAIEGTGAVICDTRKTLPGLRAIEKYAVTAGGGRNHRYNLTDAAMLKDNHIDAYGSMTAAVKALRERIGHTVKIEVEVRDFHELEEALALNADIIMLDNMSCEDMARAVKMTAGRAKLEASGNVTLDNIRTVAQSGVDIISLGALTHSVTAFDISMKWEKKEVTA